MRKPQENPIKYFGFVLVPFITFLLGWSVGFNQAESKWDRKIAMAPDQVAVAQSEEDKTPLDLQLLWETLATLKDKYVRVEDFNDNKLLYGTIRGLVDSLDDPYTVFMDPEENSEFKDSLMGELQGIGAELTMNEGLLTVVSPIKNSPAAQAGVRPQDIIIKINDEDATDFTLTQAVLKIRGPKGTAVSLTILHQDNKEIEEVTLVRDVIKIDSVSYERVADDQLALISVSQFGDTTTSEFDRILDQVLIDKPKGIILDLRFNGGGLLEKAIEMVSRFIDEDKVVVIIKKRDPTENEIHLTSGNKRIPDDMPVVILINKGSASASEIVAGAMKDHKRAYLIGEQSFGKGTVQEVVDLSIGSSLRVTVAEWYTPNDININDTGISPDLVVERTLENFKADEDPQLDEAINYLLID